MQRWEESLRRLQAEFSSAVQTLQSEFQARETELGTLRELDLRLQREDVSLTETCEFIVHGMARLLNAEYAEVLMRRHHELKVVAAIPQCYMPLVLDLKDSVTGWCALEGKSVRLGNVRTDSQFSRLYKECRGQNVPRMNSELAVPVKFDGTTISVLNVESPKQNAFDEHHEGVLKTLAGQTSLAFKKIRLFNDAEVFVALRPHLLSKKHTADVEIQKILSGALSELKTFLGEIKHFQILFREGERLVVAYSSSGKDINIKVNISDCVSGEAVLKREAVLVDDVGSHPKYVRMLGESIKSEMAVPIVVKGDVTGVLNFESEELAFFDQFSKVIVQNFSAQMAWLLTLLKLRFELSAKMRADRANEILKALGDQTGNLIHRLRDIVGPIRLQAEEIQLYHAKALVENRALAELLENIRNRAVDALKLPSEMQRMFAELDFVDVNSVIREIVEQFQRREGITITVKASTERPQIKCQGLGAILYTVIENAVDAMPNGGRIIVSSSILRFENLKDELVEISVKDEGVGIAPEDLDSVFEWGFSTKAKQEKGLGWGLAWVKTFVENVAGTISVESEVGEGSTFRFRFPGATSRLGASDE